MAPWYQGYYAEHGTAATVKIELARPLEYEDAPEAPPLHRIVTMINYGDTKAMTMLLEIANTVNASAGMDSASLWDAYKEAGREDLDVITGFQLVDLETRLFVFEGQAAQYDGKGTPINGMAKLGAALTRTKPNAGSEFTLMDEYLHFPSRVYNTFEMPTKLMRMRAPLPSLLRRPDVYQHMRVTDGCQAALLCIGGLLRSQSLRHAFKNFCFMEAQALLDLEKKFGGAITVIDREGVPLGGDDEMSDEEDEGHELTAGAPAPSAAGGSFKKKRKHASRKAATDAHNQAYLDAVKEREARPRIDYQKQNIADLPKPGGYFRGRYLEPRKPLPEWYLATIPKVGENEQVYAYSGQRLNHTDVQKAKMREAAAKLLKSGVLPTYYPSLLYCDEIGERELPPPPDRFTLGGWDNKRQDVYNKDGTKSQFRILQPSAARVEQLGVAYGEEEEEVARQFKEEEAATEELYGLSGRSRWDPLPSKKVYLDADPQKLFQSVFQQTEEQILAETKAMYEGAVETWKSKLVVDDPVLHLTMRSSDKVAQADRYKGILHDPAMKKSLKGLYRGKKPLVGGDNTGLDGPAHRRLPPSIFADESTQEVIAEFENSLRVVDPKKWQGTLSGKSGRGANMDTYIATKDSLLADRLVSSRTLPPVLPHEEYSRAYKPVPPEQRTGPMWHREKQTTTTDVDAALRGS